MQIVLNDGSTLKLKDSYDVEDLPRSTREKYETVNRVKYLAYFSVPGDCRLTIFNHLIEFSCYDPRPLADLCGRNYSGAVSHFFAQTICPG